MERRDYLKMAGGIVGVGILGSTPVAASGPIEYPPGAANDRGNWIRGRSELVDVSTVEEKTADPNASNFEEEFTYWKVTFEAQTYYTWVYRETARLGGGNFVWEIPGGRTSSAFWYGVTAPDSNGIQHQIVHDGQAIQYYETDDGWMEMTAKFEEGELLSVNGVEPE